MSRLLCWLVGSHTPRWAMTPSGYECRTCGCMCNQHGERIKEKETAQMTENENAEQYESMSIAEARAQIELLSCPFCAADAQFEEGDFGEIFVGCTKCWCHMGGAWSANAAEAAKRWNTRPEYTVFAHFGGGGVAVGVGEMSGEPCVGLSTVAEPGVVGADIEQRDDAPFPHVVMTFPTMEQARKVWAALTTKKTAVEEENERLRDLAATCYAGLVAECDLPAEWADVLFSASQGEEFETEHLLPFRSTQRTDPDQHAVPVGWIARKGFDNLAKGTGSFVIPERKIQSDIPLYLHPPVNGETDYRSPNDYIFPENTKFWFIDDPDHEDSTRIELEFGMHVHDVNGCEVLFHAAPVSTTVPMYLTNPANARVPEGCILIGPDLVKTGGKMDAFDKKLIQRAQTIATNLSEGKKENGDG